MASSAAETDASLHAYLPVKDAHGTDARDTVSRRQAAGKPCGLTIVPDHAHNLPLDANLQDEVAEQILALVRTEGGAVD